MDHATALATATAATATALPLAVTTTTTISPTMAPTELNLTETFKEAELAEEEHEFDAISALALNLVIIGCLLLAYMVKKFRVYSLPESAAALMVGMVVGGIVRLTTDNLALFKFSPEVFFFFLLPPIIFEAGYSLDRKGFFENIGAITLYAMVGTLISTFVVGILCFYAAKIGMISGIDKENPMESLMFGALISAVDPVATLSIMGNAELGVDPLLYSLVFGESVLNDAIAISLFKTFFEFYKPEGPNWSESQIPSALMSFIVVSGLSIVVGVSLGLAASWLYKHTDLNRYPNLETSLLFCFCYLCYATAEAMALSGIMALFFQGIVLSHYNSYNLSETAHVASEQIFATFATLTETIVFVYMGMGVFTGHFRTFDPTFAIIALIACWIGRFLNIVPLSWISNLCRRGRHTISGRHQAVLCFAGLRGAIAFALSQNMPGPHREVYATTTLSICIFTTLVCGGFTARVLSVFGMKEDRAVHLVVAAAAGGGGGGDHHPRDDHNNNNNNNNDGNNGGGADLNKLNRLTYTPPPVASSRRESHMEIRQRKIKEGIKGLWYRFDDHVLKYHFGGGDDDDHHHHVVDDDGDVVQDYSGLDVVPNANGTRMTTSNNHQNGNHRNGDRVSTIEMGSIPHEESKSDDYDDDDDDDGDDNASQHRSLLN